ncbi:MAG TPA: sulfurtransferase [Acidimicrobiales bacterium]|nr:sulfurtransferase [Acidimicrobiales bacterium]
MPNSPRPPIVDATWLAQHGGDVVLADVRWYLDGRSGHGAYLERHLPGAVFVDLDVCLSAAPSRAAGRHPLPAPHDFARAMESVGISDDTTVVAYDDDYGRTAARLVWLLRVTGHAASVLDGGMDAWPGPFVSGPEQRSRGAFSLDRWPSERFATAGDIGPGSVLLDARAPERYRGETEPVDARAGHIPGARNAPTAANLDERGRFKAPAALRAEYEGHGVSFETSPIVYCGSGVTACHDLLALELAGFDRGRLYAGSWSQWSADPTRPVATGAGGDGG